MHLQSNSVASGTYLSVIQLVGRQMVFCDENDAGKRQAAVSLALSAARIDSDTLDFGSFRLSAMVDDNNQVGSLYAVLKEDENE